MARVTEAYYDRKKKEITDAALRVCNRKTVSSMTMQDVINETGLSQGAIYRYYQNIDELLADLLSRIHEDQYETVDRLNDYLNTDTEEITALRALPLTKENRAERRRLIARQVRMLHAAWAAIWNTLSALVYTIRSPVSIWCMPYSLIMSVPE